MPIRQRRLTPGPEVCNSRPRSVYDGCVLLTGFSRPRPTLPLPPVPQGVLNICCNRFAYLGKRPNPTVLCEVLLQILLQERHGPFPSCLGGFFCVITIAVRPTCEAVSRVWIDIDFVMAL